MGTRKALRVLSCSPTDSFYWTTKGDAAEIIRRTESGIIVRNDEHDIYNAFLNYHRHWRGGYADWNPNLAAVERFDKRVQTRQLCQLLEFDKR